MHFSFTHDHDFTHTHTHTGEQYTITVQKCVHAKIVTYFHGFILEYIFFINYFFLEFF